MTTTIRFFGLISFLTMAGCATSGTSGDRSTVKTDSKAAERARPYLAQHYGLDFKTASTGSKCVVPGKTKDTGSSPTTIDWRVWVASASACVEKQDWALVEKLGSEMAARDIDSPWGPYFLGLAAAQRGEHLRAEWMLDLTEKKAGGPVGLVEYERARWIEKAEGSQVAAKVMKQAVRIDGTLFPALLWLAQIHHRDRMMSEAETYYRNALALKNDSWSVLVGLADMSVEKKKGAEAADFLLRAIQLKPEIAETRVRLAFVYEALTNEPGKAVQTLRELRVALEKGRARGKVNFGGQLDLDSKIKSIEQTMKSEPAGQARERAPAQKKGG